MDNNLSYMQSTIKLMNTIQGDIEQIDYIKDSRNEENRLSLWKNRNLNNTRRYNKLLSLMGISQLVSQIFSY